MSTVVGAKLKLSEILIIGFKGLRWDGVGGGQGSVTWLASPIGTFGVQISGS